jgi:iron complex outermembrane receptor protein
MTKETVISRSLRLMFSGSVVLGLGAFNAAQAQTAPDAPAMQRVEITGSSIKRAQAEGGLPVQTVTHEDIAKLGVTNTEALLASITANTAVGGVSTANGVGSSTYGLSSASLRGIGSSKTLVLVNGRRLANYATDGTSVDINSIPLAAVDHVELLKDGASGVYGSDAIGGVINFILRNNFNGVEVTGYGSGRRLPSSPAGVTSTTTATTSPWAPTSPRTPPSMAASAATPATAGTTTACATPAPPRAAPCTRSTRTPRPTPAA